MRQNITPRELIGKLYKLEEYREETCKEIMDGKRRDVLDMTSLNQKREMVEEEQEKIRSHLRKK